MKVFLSLLLAAGFASGALSAEPQVRRIFRTPRYTRGNTNLLRVQSIDRALWHAPREDPGPGPFFTRYRQEFEVGENDGTLVFDVSADERFTLRLDGALVARGPHRGSVENWMYESYAVDLAPGRHVFEATVACLGEDAPLAQLSYKGGSFIFAAEGVYDERLTTGKVRWPCGYVRGTRKAGKPKEAFGIGAEWEVTGAGADFAEPEKWLVPYAVKGRGFVNDSPVGTVGLRTIGWLLFPSQLPDPLSRRCLPGRVVAVSRAADAGAAHVFTAAETNETVDLSRPFTVPPHRRLSLAWDLGDYFCAYPELRVSGGRGARVRLAWAEATVRADTGRKGHETNARNLIVGRRLEGITDTFLPDGRAGAVFTLPWFRCGKWCRLDIETGDEPLVVDGVALDETRYPLVDEGAFAAPEDPSLADIRRISRRALEMCSHEMLFDCPYFEQQMYPGDGRVELNVLSAVTRDDRLTRRVIEVFDLARRDDGMVPFDYPTRMTAEGATYTLCHLLMYGDYVRDHANRDWLRARLPGMRNELSAFELYENDAGLLENLPGWCFIDWPAEWKGGVPPGGHYGEGPSSIANGFYLLAILSVADVERAFGNDRLAEHLEAKAARLRAAIRATFYDEQRALFADSPGGKRFSEHAQTLALLGDVVTGAEAEGVFRRLVADRDLVRATVYFSYYLFETYFKFGRGDLFLEKLALWRDYVRKGLCTTQEAPDSGAAGQVESRSDCHAWGSHPIWFFETGLAGIRSDAPFFARVRVAPCPGVLREIRARRPHPAGVISVDLRFDGGKAHGTVETPVPGEFVWGGRSVPLKAGRNVILQTPVFASIPPLNTNRVEVIETYSENIYGVRPDLSNFRKTCTVTDRDIDLGLKARRKDAVLNVATPHGERNFTAVGFFPEQKGPVPCFVYISFEDPDLILSKKAHHPDRWPVDLILERGYATVAFFYRNVFPDNPNAFAPDAKRPPNGWGGISTWALAASRVCDWLETEPAVDATKIALVGHSRLGKTAIWAGATDTRFAYVVSNDSGCMGALPVSCTIEDGETIADLMDAPWGVHWFAPNCRKFVGRADSMPFDQHWLLACIAPRLLAVGSAEDDRWACPSGEHMGLELARPAWGAARDRCHYHIRPGEHDINRIDWTDYLDFAASHGW